jgi:Uma2 family endonuclease
MDLDTDVLSLYQVPRHRLTVADYHRLAEAGILGEDDRVELLQGQLVDMSPVGPRHALAVDALTELLFAAVTPPARVRVQNPVALDIGTQPNPDIAVVRRPWTGYPHAHPGPADIFLIVEVSDSSLSVDLGAKQTLYALAGVREYWIVDLTADVVRVHRGPENGTFSRVTRVPSTGMLQIEVLPDVAIPALPLFT